MRSIYFISRTNNQRFEDRGDGGRQNKRFNERDEEQERDNGL